MKSKQFYTDQSKLLHGNLADAEAEVIAIRAAIDANIQLINSAPEVAGAPEPPPVVKKGK